MRILIVKTGAAGDVLRTTPILRRLADASVDWLTAEENVDLLPMDRVTPYTNPEDLPARRYDLLVSLEDDVELAHAIFSRVSASRVVGAYPRQDGALAYTDDAAPWFDLGLISRFGRQEADRLKLRNTLSYQHLLFQALGWTFAADEYILPPDLPKSGLRGDIAFAPQAGARWPMKNWPFYVECIGHFARTYQVNILPKRPTLREHMADIMGHAVVVSNDSLPMHIGMGLGKRCVAFFTCTSPTEVYGYGRLIKLVSPLLPQYFYRRDYEFRGASAIPLKDAIAAINAALEAGERKSK